MDSTSAISLNSCIRDARLRNSPGVCAAGTAASDERRFRRAKFQIAKFGITQKRFVHIW